MSLCEPLPARQSLRCRHGRGTRALLLALFRSTASDEALATRRRDSAHDATCASRYAMYLQVCVWCPSLRLVCAQRAAPRVVRLWSDRLVAAWPRARVASD